MTKYVLIIAATTVLVFAGLAYFFYAREQSALEKVAAAQAETVQVRADLDTATKVNKQQESIITALRAGFRIANELAADLAGEVETITTEADSLRDEIQKLKDTDDAVRTYLDTSVPDALRLRYNKADSHRAN